MSCPECDAMQRRAESAEADWQLALTQRNELLAACRAVVPWVAIIPALRDPQTTHPRAIQNQKSDLAMLLAAIKRAEGGQS